MTTPAPDAIPEPMLRALDDALGALPQPDSRFERDRWRIVSRAVYYAVQPLIAAAAIVGHEHAWTRCAACPHDGPCACAGGICCPGEQRENEARGEGAAAERERTRRLLLGCQDCGREHQPHPAVSHSASGKPFEHQSWAAPDGHSYRPPRLGHAEVASLLGEDASG